jgi:uncharacterized protein DUF6941
LSETPSNAPARKKSRLKQLAEVTVDSLMLSDSAQESNGKLYILGGGWDTIFVDGPDSPIPSISITFRIVIPWNQTNQDIAIELQLVDSDGLPMLGDPPVLHSKVGRPPHAENGIDQVLPVAMTFQNLVFQRPGQYFFRLSEAGKEVNRYRFNVIFRSPLST